MRIDWIVPAVGVSLTVVALLLRGTMQRAAEARTGNARARARFSATLVPVAMREGGCLLALTVWMITGRAVPHLVSAMVILAIAIVPFSDPEARQPPPPKAATPMQPRTRCLFGKRRSSVHLASLLTSSRGLSR